MAALQKHSTALPVMCRLSVRVIQAVGIPAMDEGGTSDPYIILTCGQMKKRTGVQMRTLHPR
jgi:Ca2+-dependent lipid-binding protein